MFKFFLFKSLPTNFDATLVANVCVAKKFSRFNTFEKGLEFSLFSKKLNASKGGK